MKNQFGRLLLLAALAFLPGIVTSVSAAPIRVVVWDERQPEQKTAYKDFLGNTLAAYLKRNRAFEVKSTGLDEPEQGLSAETLDHCDVLIWWGHKRHGDVTPEHVKAIVDRIKAGKLSLIALHSAHWSKPFIAAMNARSIEDALKTVPAGERDSIKIVEVPAPGGMPKRDGQPTPFSKIVKGKDGKDALEVHLPSCVFPFVQDAGRPGHLTTLLPNHPIAQGVPAKFDVPQTEIYGGPFHVPKPDAEVFEEHWDNGESFPSGSAWQVGKGRVFYFRPGHEMYAIFTQQIPLRIVENAVKWAAAR